MFNSLADTCPVLVIAPLEIVPEKVELPEELIDNL